MRKKESGGTLVKECISYGIILYGPKHLTTMQFIAALRKMHNQHYSVHDDDLFITNNFYCNYYSGYEDSPISVKKTQDSMKTDFKKVFIH